MENLALLRRMTVLSDIDSERIAQVAKWGEQNHPNGTSEDFIGIANDAREMADEAARSGELTWHHILAEEFYEAVSEEDPALLRAELVQVAAVAVAWVEAIDRRADA